jgi:hypothetical protein
VIEGEEDAKGGPAGPPPALPALPTPPPALVLPSAAGASSSPSTQAEVKASTEPTLPNIYGTMGKGVSARYATEETAEPDAAPAQLPAFNLFPAQLDAGASLLDDPSDPLAAPADAANSTPGSQAVPGEEAASAESIIPTSIIPAFHASKADPFAKPALQDVSSAKPTAGSALSRMERMEKAKVTLKTQLFLLLFFMR